jgi:hypothetical protein
MRSTERRRETLIALRATHEAHRIVNEIRYPELANDPPSDPAFASLAPEELEGLRQSFVESQRAKKVMDSRLRTRNWLVLFAFLMAVQLVLWIAQLMSQKPQ